VIRRVCVYCGSRVGARPEFAAAAQALGKAIAGRGWDLVYGGASVGLMGIVADSVLEAGRSVHGVIPHALFDREVAHRGISELIEVDSMHERKARMAELADAFVALPGGFGTLEEIFEALTWTQIGIHAKPCGLLNVAGYFDDLAAFLDRTVREGFVAARNREHLVVADDPAVLLGELERCRGRGGLAVEWTTAHRRTR
jgi:uncharacterized protein (TIGR00730 family)